MPKHPNDRLTPFIHDELDEVEVRAIEEHLAGCEGCRAELAELERTDAFLAGLTGAGLTAVDAPEHLWTAIEKGLIERDQRQRPRRWWLAAAVAALVVLALGIGIRIGWNQRPDAGKTLDVAVFLAALEAAPRQDDSRELALLPAGFQRVDPLAAARVAGLGRNGSAAPTLDSQLYGGRILEIAGQQVSELIYGNAGGPYLLFVSPAAIALDFGERRLEPFPAVSSTCARVASGGLSVFWDADADRQWLLVGRDHSDAFYAEVLRFVAAVHPEAETGLPPSPNR